MWIENDDRTDSVATPWEVKDRTSKKEINFVKSIPLCSKTE